MVEVIKLAILLAVPSTGVFYIMLFNLPNFSKILKNTAFALLVLGTGMGALSLPAAQAQPTLFAMFGPDEITNLSPKKSNFVIDGSELRGFCQAFNGCQAAVLKQGEVKPVPKSVKSDLEQAGFRHKSRRINGEGTISRFTPKKNSR